jgi:hypothetical protein
MAIALARCARSRRPAEATARRCRRRPKLLHAHPKPPSAKQPPLTEATRTPITERSHRPTAEATPPAEATLPRRIATRRPPYTCCGQYGPAVVFASLRDEEVWLRRVAWLQRSAGGFVRCPGGFGERRFLPPPPTHPHPHTTFGEASTASTSSNRVDHRAFNPTRRAARRLTLTYVTATSPNIRYVESQGLSASASNTIPVLRHPN